MNVSVLHGIYLHSQTVDEWLFSKQGLSPIEIVTTCVLPELDGRIEPIVTHGIKERLVEGVKLAECAPIEDRINKLAQRTVNWVNLRKKKNAEKRIAIILYNYPPGEENIGKAEYLNVFESLSRLLKAMKVRGYNVTILPSGEELKNIIVAYGIVNAGKWIQTPKKIEKIIRVSQGKYAKWLEEMPGKPMNKVVEEWGQPPGQIMNYNNSLIIPGMLLGNIFIGLQPPRGVHEVQSKIYHDKALPPHHQYIAFYKWLRDEFKADAVIHFGTHGTLEFLPGKEAGLSSECFPDILIGDLPNVNIYHAVNSSESSIAKRRSYALIVNHASPPLTTSELHGDLQEIERLIREYFDALQYKRENADTISGKILKYAEKYQLGATVEEVYDKLHEYKRSMVPKGLHILGDKLSKEDALEYLTFLARYDRGEIRSLHKLVIEAKGLSYSEILEKPHKKGPDGKTHAQIFDETEKIVKSMIEEYVINKGSQTKMAISIRKDELEKSLQFLKQIYYQIEQTDEIKAVLDALEGKFIPPGPGGDFVRTPEIFPTGRNTYQLDPTGIPTETAMERGMKIAEDLVKNYYDKNGTYPKTVSIVLWAFETMKTGGETIAAIFHLLGVKPVWKGLYIRDLEVIHAEQLKRPRIDVVVTICGIFRDTFYNIVELLDRAVRTVAELDEPEEVNYVRANMVKAVAKHGENAKFRIFGPPEGQYATSLTALIESSQWRSEAELVNAYFESMKFAYGEKQRNIESKEALNTLLSGVDVVAQVRDTVDYEITDLDHYYEFLGGLTKTVESKKGKKPLVLLADTTKETVKVDAAQEHVKRGIITRTSNPKWLDHMLESGANGVTKIADKVEYMLGLAATLGGVENWMWDIVAENTVFNLQRAEKMRVLNPWAFQKIIKRFVEANKRGYWRTTAEVLQKLRLEYLRIEGTLEETYT